MSAVSFAALALCGVGHDKDALTEVRRARGTSRNHNRPRVVAIGRQVSEYEVECHAGETRHVLNTDPSGPASGNDAASLWPEMTVIVGPPPLARDGPGLARDAAENKINCSALIARHLSDIRQPRHARPVARQHGAAIVVNFHLAHD
jgi:hypothetical protein